MNCLHNYVGIKGCGADAPESGQYVNQLPGISLESMQRVADKEQVTYVQVFEDVQARAWRRLSTDLRNALRARHNIRTVRRTYVLESTPTGSTSVQPSPNLRGIVLDSGLNRNGLFAFRVDSVRVALPSVPSALAVLIYDEHGALLDTLNVDTPALSNTVAVGQTYAASRLFIAVDATAIELASTTARDDFGSYLCASLCNTCSTAQVYGGEAVADTPAAIGRVSNTFGISATVSAVCDFTVLVCRDRELFLDAWMNLLGAELMMERMFSTRINRFTTVDAGDADKLRDLYTAQYENALDDAVAGIRIAYDDACIECSDTITRKEHLP